MKERLSNLSTSSRHGDHYAFALSGIGFLIASIYQLVTRNYVLAIVFLLFGLLFLGLSFFLYRYYSMFYDVFMDDNFIFISDDENNMIKIELEKISSVYYHHSFFYGQGSIESIIVVEFTEKIKYGKKIMFFPTSLESDNTYRLNRNILTLIKENVDNYNKNNVIEQALKKE
jgi:hypothetical protein